jgi:hypothetical protein
MSGSKYLRTGIGSTVELQHTRGRVQSEQTEQATDLEKGGVVAAAIHGVQLLQGIDPFRSCCALDRRQ